MDQSDHVTELYIYSFVYDNFFFTKYLSENLGNVTKYNNTEKTV